MEILKNKQFLKLWGNQVLLQIAFNMCNFTALLLINQLSSSRFALAQFYAAMTLPAFFVGIFAGAIVDMTNRKALMLITDGMLTFLFIMYAFSTHQHWGILVIAFLSASIAQFFTPAEAATIPLIVKESELEKANALFLFTQLGAVMLGFAIAGPIIQLFGGLNNFGGEVTFIMAACLTGIGFLLRLSLHTVETSYHDVIRKKIFLKTLLLTKEVIDTSIKNWLIILPIVLLTFIEFTTGMLSILFIDYVKQYLSLPATATSMLLVIPLIIGLCIGIAVLNRLERKVGRGISIFLGGLSFGIILTLLGLSARFLSTSPTSLVIIRSLTILSALSIGVSVVLIAVHARTVLQENTPHNMLGRIFSLVAISASAITPIPILLVALITDRLDVTTVFILLGISILGLVTIIRPLLLKYIPSHTPTVISEPLPL